MFLTKADAASSNVERVLTIGPRFLSFITYPPSLSINTANHMAILALIFIDFSELLAMFSRHATTLFPVQLRAMLYRAASASSLRKDEASTHFFITLGNRKVSSWSSDLGMYVAMSFSSISAFFEREDLKL